MMNMAAAAGGNQNPELGILLHHHGAMAAAFSTEQFLTQYLELYYELELEVISHRLCATYLGTLTPVSTQAPERSNKLQADLFQEEYREVHPPCGTGVL